MTRTCVRASIDRGRRHARAVRLRGDEPDPSNGATLEALEYVWTRLLRLYKPSTAVKWLHGFNAHLGNRRPISLLKQGRVSEVIGAIEQDEAGSYA